MYFDIGANIGQWALSNIDRCEKIVCVEASPNTFQNLVLNCRNPNIECVNYAVCNNNNEPITFYEADACTISTINEDWLSDPSSRFYNYCGYTEITCKSITIDSLISHYGKPSLIKVDVEGGEYQCISSLTQKVDTLCFEWASETNEITLRCLEYLESLGFTQFYLQFKDDYTFRPSVYTTIHDIKQKLAKTIPKEDWGMIWCV